MKQILIFVITFFFFSCSDEIVPSGIIASETRSVTPFSKVESSNGFRISISQSTDIMLKVEADDNIIQYVETYVSNGTLILKIRDRIDIDTFWSSRTKTVNITLSANVLNSLVASGGSQISFNKPFNQEEMSINSSGGSSVSGNITCTKLLLTSSGGGIASIDGTCKNFNLNASGGSKFNLYELKADNINIDISGGSLVELYANLTLNVSNASGGSQIYYKGNAQIIGSNLSGGSSITKQ